LADYTFISAWQIEAPIEAVWRTITHTDEWPAWWTSVKRIERVQPGDEHGVGSRWRIEFRSKLPYTLKFAIQVVEADPPRVSVGESTGDLVGIGRWDLAQTGGGTTVQYTWNVRTTEAWMNALAPVLRPVFSWNHNVSMRECAEGMATHLHAKLIFSRAG
jgi:uncharacterized protein YndB with AHSA1/START domain